jgi:acetoacetyl-CoA synthetase
MLGKSPSAGALFIDAGWQKVYKPRGRHDLSTLRHIYSTGSPLAHALFDYVYEHIHPGVLLASITGGISLHFILLRSSIHLSWLCIGGTDICSLFAGMCTALPVYRGEIQCRLLGMAIETFSPKGVKTAPGQAGELVCVRPFPCMPVGFWPLPGFGAPQEAVEAAAERFRQAYFAEYKHVWCECQISLVLTPRSFELTLFSFSLRSRRPCVDHAISQRKRRWTHYAGKK